MSLTSENGPTMTMPVAPAYGGMGGCGMGGFGGDGWWGILFLIAIMSGGWGGFGGFGGMGSLMSMWPFMFGGFGNGSNGAAAQGALTRGELCQDMNFQSLENGVRGIQQGLCDGFYSVNTSLLNGFHGVDNAVCNLGYQTQQGINSVNTNMMQGFNASNIVALQNQNALQTQLADCCCKNQTGQMQLGNAMERGFCDMNYGAATNTNAIIQNAHNDADRIIARFDAFERSQDKAKIAEQAAEIQAYKQNAVFGARIDAATAEILRRSGHDCPVAAYVVPNPNCCYGNPVGVSYGYNQGCSNCGQCA